MSMDSTDVPEINTPLDNEPLHQLTMNDVLENRAAKIGSKTFIHYGPEERDVSFGEMDEKANSIGNGLVELGVERGQKVSVLMRHPLETLFAMFGIHKAGGVYSPINFEYKGNALSYQINDTNPEVLILEDQYAGRVNDIKDDIENPPEMVVYETGAESEILDDDFNSTTLDDLRIASSGRPDVELDCYDEASIVYTSGTTGNPKGVVLPHRWIFGNYTLLFGQMMNEDDIVHTSLPLYHVGGIYADITAALVAGASVSLWNRFSPHDFWDRIDKYGATRTILLSVMIPWLMKQEPTPEDRENTLKMVHMQPLPDNYDEVANRFGFDIVTAGFGQTESGNPLAGFIHTNPGGTPEEYLAGMTPNEIIKRAEDLKIPVVDDVPEDRYMGKPVFFMDAAIIDENDERLPPGETGELAFRPKQSHIILQEYYNKPERTLEATKNLWFHTGDAAYRDEEGNFYFVDRIGDVIRRRGENISSMQIQDVMNAYDEVAQAAIFPVPAEEGGEDEIGAAIEPADNDFTEDAVFDYLDGRLPEFMHPDHLLVVEELPTTETNKIEKYKLRDQLIDR